MCKYVVVNTFIYIMLFSPYEFVIIVPNFINKEAKIQSYTVNVSQSESL